MARAEEPPSIREDLGVKPRLRGKVFSHLNPTAHFAGETRRGKSLSQRTTGGRYRADRRPVTPLTTLGEYVTGPIGRRAAAAAASTGIIFTMTAAGSIASPTAGTATLAKDSNDRSVDSSDNLTSGPTVSVEEDAKWSFVSAASGSSATPPPPPPEPVATTTTAQSREVSPSRTGTRDAAPAEASTESAPAEEEVSSAPASGTGAAIVAEARKYVGTPYKHGGTTPGAFDCSGFTSYVFSKFGVSLPPSSGAQRGAGRIVSASEARPGDLVWWPGHVGIYTGNGNHIAARNPSTPLYESKLFRGGATYIRVID